MKSSQVIRWMWLTLVVFYLPGKVYAQAITIETEIIPVEVYQIPLEPLSPDIKTYSASINLPGELVAVAAMNGREMSDKYINLAGYKKVPAPGDIHILVNVGTLSITGEKMDSRKSQTIDKAGNPITKHEFYMTFNYATNVSYKLTDKSGKVIAENFIADINDKKTHKTDIYAKDQELEAYWRTNKTNKTNELHKALVVENLGKLREDLNRRYGFSIVRENAHFETIGKKKHPQFESYNGQLLTIKSILGSLGAEGDAKEAAAGLNEAISFFDSAAKSNDGDDKEKAKLTHIALFNLASLYFWLDDFEKADAYLTQLLAVDQEDKEAQKLADKIRSTRESLAAAGKSSRRRVMS